MSFWSFWTDDILSEDCAAQGKVEKRTDKGMADRSPGVTGDDKWPGI